MRKHVVFVVDASRSMERRDVFEDGQRKRRVDAVLDCCFEFIEVSLVLIRRKNLYIDLWCLLCCMYHYFAPGSL